MKMLPEIAGKYTDPHKERIKQVVSVPTVLTQSCREDLLSLVYPQEQRES